MAFSIQPAQLHNLLDTTQQRVEAPFQARGYPSEELSPEVLHRIGVRRPGRQQMGFDPIVLVEPLPYLLGGVPLGLIPDQKHLASGRLEERFEILDCALGRPLS